MKVTDNLKNDISNAPEWFFKSIESFLYRFIELEIVFQFVSIPPSHL